MQKISRFKAKITVIIVFIGLMFAYQHYFYQSPVNDAFAYYNIGSNLISRGRLVNDEIFPNTLVFVKSFPAPVFRRSLLYSLLTVPFLLVFDSPLCLSYLSVVFTIINLILLMFIAQKLFSPEASVIAAVFYILNPLTYTLAFSGLVEVVFATFLLTAFFFLYRDAQLEHSGYIVLFSIILSVSLYLRPHALLFMIATGLLLLVRKSFKKLMVFMLIAVIVSAPLSIYKAKQGIPDSLSKYFLLDSLGRKYSNHRFERMLNPDEPVKVILENKLLFVKKLIRKTLAQLKFLVYHPFNSVLLFLMVYFFVVYRDTHPEMVCWSIFSFMVIMALFSIFFVERIRYYWPILIIIMLLNSKNITVKSRKFKTGTILVFVLIFLGRFLPGVINHMPLKGEDYYTIRKKIMENFAPYVNKGVMTDIPWAGAAFLKKPCIWIPAGIKDVKKVKSLTGIDQILVSGVWIEPDKIIEDYPLSAFKTIRRIEHVYSGKKVVSVLYKLEN